MSLDIRLTPEAERDLSDAATWYEDQGAGLSNDVGRGHSSAPKYGSGKDDDMANKLAGQRAKFSRARSIYFTDPDESARERAVELMAEVIADAERFDFTEEMVTQGEDVPDVVRDYLRRRSAPINVAEPVEEDPNTLVRELDSAVDTTDVQETGRGSQWVYAYGYRCAPDRLKIGSCTAEVEARVAAQIHTGTPDKPRLMLKIATHDCRALERALHGALRVRGKRIDGAGAEWFRVARDELLALYRAIIDGA